MRLTTHNTQSSSSSFPALFTAASEFTRIRQWHSLTHAHIPSRTPTVAAREREKETRSDYKKNEDIFEFPLAAQKCVKTDECNDRDTEIIEKEKNQDEKQQKPRAHTQMIIMKWKKCRIFWRWSHSMYNYNWCSSLVKTFAYEFNNFAVSRIRFFFFFFVYFPLVCEGSVDEPKEERNMLFINHSYTHQLDTCRAVHCPVYGTQEWTGAKRMNEWTVPVNTHTHTHKVARVNAHGELETKEIGVKNMKSCRFIARFDCRSIYLILSRRDGPLVTFQCCRTLRTHPRPAAWIAFLKLNSIDWRSEKISSLYLPSECLRQMNVVRSPLFKFLRRSDNQIIVLSVPWAHSQCLPRRFVLLFKTNIWKYSGAPSASYPCCVQTITDDQSRCARTWSPRFTQYANTAANDPRALRHSHWSLPNADC